MKHLRNLLSLCCYFFFWYSQNLVQAQNESSESNNTNQLDILKRENQNLKFRLEMLEQHFNKQRQFYNDIDLTNETNKVLQTCQAETNSIENWLTLESWENQTKLLKDLNNNFTILQNSVTGFFENMNKYLNTSGKSKQQQNTSQSQLVSSTLEQSKICVREGQKLICSSPALPTNCADNNESYCTNDKCRIQNQLYGPESFLVACDDLTDGGGWTIIQRRINGSVDFFREWSEYKQGFGHLDGEFFIGLDKLYALTNSLEPVELLIQLKDFNDTLKYAKYDSFAIGNETEKYVLKDVGKYTGNAEDSFSMHKSYKFSTKDQDNDEYSDGNCAIDKKGAWWYRKCQWSNLNGFYYKTGEVPRNLRGTGINWEKFHDFYYSMKFVQMMIRPKKF